MDTEELLNRLVERLGQRQAEADHHFQQLAADLAEGREVSEEDAFTVLQAAGKTAQQLAAEVRKLRRIKELEQIVSEEAAVMDAIISLNEQRSREIDQEEQEQKELALRRNQAHSRYLDALNVLHQKKDRIAEAKRELRSLTGTNEESEHLAVEQEIHRINTLKRLGLLPEGRVDYVETCTAPGYSGRLPADS